MKGGGGGVEEWEGGRGGMDSVADGQKLALRHPDRSAFIKTVGGGGTERQAWGDPRRRQSHRN